MQHRYTLITLCHYGTPTHIYIVETHVMVGYNTPYLKRVVCSLEKG